MLQLKEFGRSRRFRARIAVERRVLDIVNSSRECQAAPLAGLTLAAIRDWKLRISGSVPTVFSADVEFLLTKIARASGLLADNSKAVFNPDGEFGDAEVRALEAELGLLLSCEAE